MISRTGRKAIEVGSISCYLLGLVAYFVWSPIAVAFLFIGTALLLVWSILQDRDTKWDNLMGRGVSVDDVRFPLHIGCNLCYEGGAHRYSKSTSCDHIGCDVFYTFDNDGQILLPEEVAALANAQVRRSLATKDGKP